LMSGYVFGYLFFVILIVVISLAVRVYRRGGVRAKEGADRDGIRFGATFWMLFFATTGYFLTVSKTALLLGETSNRYQLPVYGIAVFLVFYACRTLWRQAVALANVRPVIKTDEKSGILHWMCPSAVKVLLLIFELIGDLWGWFLTFLIRHRKYTEKAALLFCFAMLVTGYLRAGVVFLYPRAGEEVALAREQAAEGIPVVYVYNPGEEWCVWAVADVLMEYDRVYFVSAESEDVITEPAIANAEALVAYLPLYDDGKDGEAQNMRVAASCKASEERQQYVYKYCESWYYFRGQ
ncbi:MAG: hypothetical protein K2N43_07340, partial [Lachnospiraceae bacterium]|nr:hypothetical protein [Lachnospiraceae bacterium]